MSQIIEDFVFFQQQLIVKKHLCPLRNTFLNIRRTEKMKDLVTQYGIEQNYEITKYVWVENALDSWFLSYFRIFNFHAFLASMRKREREKETVKETETDRQKDKKNSQRKNKR